jgi:hypothetical protein
MPLQVSDLRDYRVCEPVTERINEITAKLINLIKSIRE